MQIRSEMAYSVKLSDVTGNPFEWQLDKNNAV